MKSTFKQYFFLLLMPLALITLDSCQKVIEIDLKDADRKYVIEGSVVEGTDSAVVRVTRTTNFFDTSPPEGISNAEVLLTMPDNSIITLDHMGNGYYKKTGLTITTNATYQLEVNVNNETFTASSFMPMPVILDTLEYEFQEGIFGNEDGYSVYLRFQDQPGPDFYKINFSVNGEPFNDSEDMIVLDDNLTDGNEFYLPIFSHTFELGDTVDVELQSIDRDLWKFYETFLEVASEGAGSPFSAAPANPETNISGGALGVFGAYTSSKRNVIVVE